ncbi:RING-H2 finger protein ATL70-like [Punica granatum]|uniref:RING-type E3 ubiquitin transferase n=2 Tax=Punica granatum TaxID=22663 RepID=A0A218VVP4_PUNGR|nr:RING-H2 finger protein ATL70-like [Punica granatum]OWM64081.1 hypothetical protein CDL15_Pgr011536 [Punica granatum]PKI48449.1 hypothetical protein CRG98_031154 [Punica granatum]
MMSNSAGISPSDSQGTISSLAYDVTFVIGFVLLILLILLACCICSRAERQAQNLQFRDGAPARQGHGINEATLSSYPKLSYSKAKHERGGESIASGCSICLVDYKESDMLRSLPRCGHMFHVKCVDPWLRMHSTCPICRTSPHLGTRVSIPETGLPPS